MDTFLYSLWAACAQHFSKWDFRASCRAAGEWQKHSSCLRRAWQENLFITYVRARSSTRPSAGAWRHPSLAMILPPCSLDTSLPLQQTKQWSCRSLNRRPESRRRQQGALGRGGCRPQVGGSVFFLHPHHRQEFGGRGWNKPPGSSLTSAFLYSLF